MADETEAVGGARPLQIAKGRLGLSKLSVPLLPKPLGQAVRECHLHSGRLEAPAQCRACPVDLPGCVVR